MSTVSHEARQIYAKASELVLYFGGEAMRPKGRDGEKQIKRDDESTHCVWCSLTHKVRSEQIFL